MLSRLQLWSTAVIGLTMLAGSASSAEGPVSSQAIISSEARMVLTRQEQRMFDDRLRAANRDAQRRQIAAESQSLMRERSTDGETTILIPPKSDEQAEDLIMPDVPTPRADHGIRGGTLPGGVLSGTGSGTSPAINRFGDLEGIGTGQR